MKSGARVRDSKKFGISKCRQGLARRKARRYGDCGCAVGAAICVPGAAGVCMACRTQGCSAKGARERGFDIERASDEGATDFDELGYRAYNCQLTVIRHTVDT